MSSVQYDTQAKAESAVRAEWQARLEALPFPVHVILQRCNEQRVPTRLNLNPARFVGQAGHWYFVCLYMVYTRTVHVLHFVAHTAVVQINRHLPPNCLWDLPVAICQQETAVTAPMAFKHYTHESFDMPLDAPGLLSDMQTAFTTRLKLYRWLRSPDSFQNSHPLNAMELKFLAPSTHEKWLDSACYFLIAKHATHELTTQLVLLESKLHAHKLLLRPDLADQLAQVLHVNHMEAEHLRILSFHVRNMRRVQSECNWPLFQHDELRKLALHFLAQYDEDMQRNESDKEHELELQDMHNERTKKGRLRMNAEVPLLDLLHCAPPCISQALHNCTSLSIQARGPDARMNDTQRQAKATVEERKRVIHYLLDQGKNKEEVMQALRPRILVQYELEEPVVGADQLGQLFDSTYQEREAEPDNKLDVRSCKNFISCQACPLFKPRPQFYWNLDQAAQKKNHKDRWVQAHKDCHAHLRTAFAKQAALGYTPSRAEAVKTDWTMSPWCFTQVAAKGNLLNIDKPTSNKDEPKAKQAKADEVEQLEDEDQQ